MQIKNEQSLVLFKHSLWFFPKEIASWVYIVFTETFTLKAVKDLFFQAPRAWQKRKIIMARKKVSAKEMKKWFK